jgi:hypothetical protein
MFDNPLRRVVSSPERMLAPWVSPGMTAVLTGLRHGYFSLGLAGWWVRPAGGVRGPFSRNAAGLRRRVCGPDWRPDEPRLPLRAGSGYGRLTTEWIFARPSDGSRGAG